MHQLLLDSLAQCHVDFGVTETATASLSNICLFEIQMLCSLWAEAADNKRLLLLNITSMRLSSSPLSLGSHPLCQTRWRSHISSPIDWGRSPVTAWPASLTHNYEDPAAMTKTDTKRAVIRCFKYDWITDTFKQEQMIDTIIRNVGNVTATMMNRKEIQQKKVGVLRLWACGEQGT